MAHLQRVGARVEILFGCLVVAVGVPACGGSSGGGGGANPVVLEETEPNDTTAQADALTLGRPGVGSVAVAGDVDIFSIALTAGSYVKVELFATRFDQAAWDAAANVPRLRLLAPDGTTVLLEHDANASVSDGWGWEPHDLDFPLYRVPATGTHFVSVAQADDTSAGGAYAVRASLVSLPAAQLEFEPAGTTGANDTPNTSQDIVPGIVRGFHADGDIDYYAVTIATPQVVRFEVTSYRNGVHDGDDGYFDPTLQLFDAVPSFLAFDEDSFFFDPAIHFVVLVPGTYFLEVAEAGGVGDASYLLSFSSANLTAAPETEPNDTTATADPIAYGGSVSGAIDVGQFDHYAFTGTAGDMVRIQVFDGENLQNAADFVEIEVLAPDGTTVLQTGGFVGHLQTFTTILQEDGTHYIRAETIGALTDYRLELSLFQSAEREVEPNDSIATANDSFDPRASGAIDAPGDVDVYSFDATQDHLVVVAIYAARAVPGSDGAFEYSGHGSDLQPSITVTDGVGTVLATSTSNPSAIFTESVTDPLPRASLAFVPADAGPFFVRVESALPAGGPTHTYVIEKR